jgi:phasin
MTTETNSVLNTVKEAFAPVTEAFTKLQNLEVPEAAREFVKKQAETAKVRAADLHAGSEKVTAAIETAVAGSVTEAANISRSIQQALYQDAEAFFAGIDKLASAKSLNEAVQIQSEMVRARGELLASRAKSTTEYLGKLVADGAKSAQDNFAKVYTKTA